MKRYLLELIDTTGYVGKCVSKRLLIAQPEPNALRAAKEMLGLREDQACVRKVIEVFQAPVGTDPKYDPRVVRIYKLED